MGSGSGDCTALNLSLAPEVPLTFGTDLGSAYENSATGGTLVEGDYTADIVEIDQKYDTYVSGSAQGIVELMPSSATSGEARVALGINATALGMAVDQTLTGAGTYTITDGHVINIANECGSGGGSALPTLYYTAGSDDEVTLWTTYTIDGLAVDIKVHIHQ